MIEVVFHDSACGSLKQAKAQNCAHIDGAARDVYGFPLSLSVGAIDSDLVGRKREEILSRLYRVYPDVGRNAAAEIVAHSREALHELRHRVVDGEDVRIWYSNHPDEQCGLYWMVSELRAVPKHSRIFLIELPTWEYREGENVLVEKSHWGETEPAEWGTYVSRQSEASSVLCMALSQKWRCLQKQNAPLRAVVNGHLIGVSHSFYDDFIRSEIARQQQEFCQAVVIGRILGKYQLGISDVWIAWRMEEMLKAGELEEVTFPNPSDPRYHRTLRRTGRMSIGHLL